MLSIHKKTLLIWTTALWMVTVSAMANPYQISELRSGDRVEASGDKIVVYSQTGIGQAVLQPKDSWPESLIFSFRYSDGRGIERMEGLRISTDTLELRGSFRNKSGIPFRFKSKSEQPTKQDSGTLQLTLPPHFADHTESLTIHWVNAYRN